MDHIFKSDSSFEIDYEGLINHFYSVHSELQDGYQLEFMGKTIRDILPAEIADLFMGAISEVSQSGKHSEVIFPFRTREGVRWFELTISPRSFRAEGENRLNAHIRDITDRRRAENWLKIQRDLGIALGETSNFKKAMDQVLEAAVEIEEVDCGGIYLVDPLSGNLELAAVKGFSQKFIEAVKFVHSDSLPAQRVRLGDPFYGSKDIEIPEFDEAIREEGLRAIGIIPIQHEGKSIAVLNIASHSCSEISPNARNVLETIAARIGGAVSRLKAVEALKESESRFRELTDLLPLTVFEVDSEGNLLFTNRCGLETFGYSPQDLKNGLNASDLFIPEDQERLLQNRRAILSELKSATNEYTALRKDRSVFPVIIYSSPIVKSNKVVGLRGIVVDVTDRVEFQKAIMESEEKARTLLNSTSESFILVDRKGKILDLNTIAARRLGRGIEELRGLTQFDFPASIIPDDILQGRRRQFKEVIRRKEPVRLEDARGGMIFDTIMYPLLDSNGEVSRLAILAKDITEQKHAEESLKQSERKYRLLVENSGLPIMILSTEGECLMMNKTSAEYLGGTPEQFIGRSSREFLAEEFVDQFLIKAGQILNTRQGIIADIQIMFRGQKMWFNTNVQPIFELDGSIASVQLIANDITARKIAEIRDRAKYRLLDALRTADDIDECLRIGCEAVFEAEMFRRAIMTLHTKEKVIMNLGQVGLDAKLVEMARSSPPPNDEMTAEITQEKFRLSHSFFIPEEASLSYQQTGRYIPAEEGIGTGKSPWKNKDELFVPLYAVDGRINGWLSVDTPFNGARPSLEAIAFLEEIVEIVGRKVREIQTLVDLKKEQQALLQKNITLKDVLSRIEEEKTGIKMEFARSVDQILLPILLRMLRKDGTVNKGYYGLLKNSMEELASSAGGKMHHYSRLSTRELEVVNFIKGGSSTKEIADALGISSATVAKHRESIRRKLGLTGEKINLISHIRQL